MDTPATEPLEPTAPRSFAANTRWRALGAGIGNGVRYVTYILLSLILGPGEMGRMALALVVVEILDSLKGAGIGQFIIQRKELRPGFLDSIATLQLLVVAALILVLVGGGGVIAGWMGNPSIAPMIQAMSFGLLMSGLAFVHQNVLARELRFDVLAKIEVTQAASYAVIALVLAWCGLGVWSMVIGHLARETIAAIAFWIASGYRTRLGWDRSVIRESLGFASHIMGSTVLNAVMSRVDQVIVGRLLGDHALGIYALAKRLILYPTRVLGMLLNTVLTSTISRIAEDHVAIRSLYLRVCATLATLAFPAVFGLAAVSPQFAAAVLDQEWEGIETLILLLSPAGAIQVLTITTMSLFISQGRPDLLFKWSLVHYACVTGAYAWAAHASIQWVPVAESGVMLLLLVPTFLIPFRLVGLRFRELVATVRAPLLASLTMAGAVYGGMRFLARNEVGPWPSLLVGALGGAVLYLALMFSFKRALLEEIWAAATTRRRARSA